MNKKAKEEKLDLILAKIPKKFKNNILDYILVHIANSLFLQTNGNTKLIDFLESIRNQLPNEIVENTQVFVEYENIEFRFVVGQYD